MSPIQWDGDLAYSDFIHISMLGVARRYDRIAIVFSDLFWRFMAEPLVSPKEQTRFEANEFLLGAISNRSVSYERAVALPQELNRRLSARLGTTDLVSGILAAGVDGVFEAMSEKPVLHRFPKEISKSAHAMATKLTSEYSSDARLIWRPTSERDPRGSRLDFARLYARLVEFRGLSVKTATLAIRCLVLGVGIELSDGLEGLEASPDVIVCRVFERLGLVPRGAKPIEVMAAARKLSELTSHSAVSMDGAWMYREICHVTEPECSACPTSDLCLFAGSWRDPRDMSREVAEALERL